MILGSKGHKSDASLLAGGFLILGPAKNMSKKPKTKGMRRQTFVLRKGQHKNGNMENKRPSWIYLRRFDQSYK